MEHNDDMKWIGLEEHGGEAAGGRTRVTDVDRLRYLGEL